MRSATAPAVPYPTVTLCPDDFSKSGISASIAGCNAEALSSLISAAVAALPTVMASPNPVAAVRLTSLRQFILALRACLSIDVGGIVARCMGRAMRLRQSGSTGQHAHAHPYALAPGSVCQR